MSFPIPTTYQIALPGLVRRLLQAEGFMIFVGAMVAFVMSGQTWWIFAAVCLAPDLSFLAYIIGPRIGAWAYNLVHNYALPLVLALLSWQLSWDVLLAASFVWIAHIGFDRMLGYGLKLPTDFAHTHLGVITSMQKSGHEPGNRQNQ